MDLSILDGLRSTSSLADLFAAVEREKTSGRFMPPMIKGGGDAETWHGYTDGSAHPGELRAGVGGYLVSPTGVICGEFAEPRRTDQSEIAEWMAIQRLLERARDAGIRKLVVHTDNQGMATVCETGFKNKHRQKLKGDIAQWRPAFDYLRFDWIPRKQNILADWLSRYCYKHTGQKICQPVSQSHVGLSSCSCASAMPLVAPSIQVATPSMAVPLAVKASVAVSTNVLEQPWCQKLVDYMAQHQCCVPADFQVEPWMLEAAAIADQRKWAKAQAAYTGQPYEQILEQALRQAATGQPFEEWLGSRLVWRMNLLASTETQMPQAPRSQFLRRQKKRDPIAFAQELRAERAKSIHVEVYLEGLYLATSSDGHTRYEVDTIRGTCTCPDFYERGHYLRCKHLIAAQNLEAEMAYSQDAAAAA